MTTFFSSEELIRENPRLNELPSWFLERIVAKLEVIYEDLADMQDRRYYLDEIYRRLSDKAEVASLINADGFKIVLDYPSDYLTDRLYELIHEHELKHDGAPGVLFLWFCPPPPYEVYVGDYYEDEDEDEDDENAIVSVVLRF